MRLSQDNVTGYNHIHSYGNNFVVVRHADNNELVRHETSFLVSPSKLIKAQKLAVPAKLNESEISMITALEPELVLYGIGSTNASLSFQAKPVYDYERFSLELMSLGSACRTYNLLCAEGRKVVLLVNLHISATE